MSSGLGLLVTLVGWAGTLAVAGTLGEPSSMPLCDAKALCTRCSCFPPVLIAGPHPILSARCPPNADVELVTGLAAQCQVAELFVRPAELPWPSVSFFGRWIPQPQVYDPHRNLSLVVEGKRLVCSCANAWLRNLSDLDLPVMRHFIPPHTPCRQQLCKATPRILNRLPLLIHEAGETCLDPATRQRRDAGDFYAHCDRTDISSGQNMTKAWCEVSNGCLTPLIIPFLSHDAQSRLYQAPFSSYVNDSSGCTRRAVIDLRSASFSDSAWLFCRQTRAERAPLLSVWKLLVAGPPEVLPPEIAQTLAERAPLLSVWKLLVAGPPEVLPPEIAQVCPSPTPPGSSAARRGRSGRLCSPSGSFWLPGLRRSFRPRSFRSVLLRLRLALLPPDAGGAGASSLRLEASGCRASGGPSARDRSGLSFSDSAWLFCRQTRAERAPLLSVWKLLVAGPPEVLPPEIAQVIASSAVTGKTTQLKDRIVNITLAGHPMPPPSNFSFYFLANHRGKREWRLDLSPDALRHLHASSPGSDWRIRFLRKESKNLERGYTTQNLVLKLRNPDTTCLYGDYAFKACNPFGCATAAFTIDTSKPAGRDGKPVTCAEANKTFIVASERIIEPPWPRYRRKPRSGSWAGPWWAVVLGSASLAGLCLGTPLALVWRLRRRAKRRRAASRQAELDTQQHLLPNPGYVTWLQTLQEHKTIPVLRGEEVETERLVGEGAFGQVFLVRPVEREANAEHPVLVRLRKEGSDGRLALKKLKPALALDTSQLEREAEVLLHLHHPHIVAFYGLSLSGDAEFGLLFEYMPDGDLINYLRAHNRELEEGAEELSQEELLRMGWSVADGLAYMAHRELVHRDVAARNVLVRRPASPGGQLVVKMSDFGMSRELSSNTYYRMGTDTLVPVRWLPPEALLYRKFTLESDVWSFGVLLWEIFSLGQVPWSNFSNFEVMDIVRSGRSLERPDKASEAFYEGIMKRCWEPKPADRPTAAELRDALAHIAKPSGGAYVHMREVGSSVRRRSEASGPASPAPTATGDFVVAFSDHGVRLLSNASQPPPELFPSASLILEDEAFPSASVVQEDLDNQPSTSAQS